MVLKYGEYFLSIDMTAKDAIWKISCWIRKWIEALKYEEFLLSKDRRIKEEIWKIFFLLGLKMELGIEVWEFFLL